MDVKIAVTGSSYAPVESFKPFQGSLKTLSDQNYEKLKTEILSTGFAFALHVWEHDNYRYLVDGHQRVATLLRMKEKGIEIPEIPFVSVEAKDYEEAKRRVLQGVSQYGKIDKEGFFDFVGDMDIGGFDDKFDLPDIDFDIDASIGGEENEGNTDPDEVPEVDGNPYGVQRGDVWQLGDHYVMCGDSTSEEDVANLMDGEKAVFCFTSPPYSDQRDYKGDLELEPKHLAKFLKAPCDLFAVNLGMKRKDNEIVPYWDDYINAAKEYGHKFLSWNIWDRSGFGYTIGQATALFAIDHEWIFVFGDRKKLNRTIDNKQSGITKKGTIREKSGETKNVISSTGSKRQLGTVVKMDVARYVGDEHKHPAMFPVELPEEYIKACSNEGNLIYEPFCGSGSTLIACEKTGRKCFGMELDENYCSVIIKRWEDFTGKKAVKVN